MSETVNVLLWSAQIALAILQGLNFLASLLMIFSGRARNAVFATAISSLTLLLGLGVIIPWWSQQAMISTPVAGALLALFVLWDGLTKQGSPLTSGHKPQSTWELLQQANEHRSARNEALYLSAVFVLAVLVAVGRMSDFVQWINSLTGWLFILGGMMTLVVCLLRSSEGPSKMRWAQAGVGLLILLAGCLNMSVH